MANAGCLEAFRLAGRACLSFGSGQFPCVFGTTVSGMTAGTAKAATTGFRAAAAGGLRLFFPVPVIFGFASRLSSGSLRALAIFGLYLGFGHTALLDFSGAISFGVAGTITRAAAGLIFGGT